MIFSKPTDDRGIEIPTLTLDSIGEGNDQFAAARKGLRKRIAAATGTSSQLGAEQTALVVFGVIGIVALAIAVGVTFGGRAALTAALVSFVGLLLLYRKVSRLVAARQIAATAVAEGFCGGCGYVLQDSEPDAEGMVRCPECGASWLAARITRPFWQTMPTADIGHLDPKLVGQDHRECFVRLMDPRMKLMPTEHKAALGPEFMSELRRRIRLEGLFPRFLLSFLFGALTITCVYTIINALFVRGVGFGTLMWPVAGTLAFGYGAFAVHWSYEGVPRQHPTAVLLGAGLCGCCGKSLATVTPDADGCRACPHCRASWKLKFPEKCAKCGYSLAGLEQPTCPECGVAWRV